MCYWCWKEHGSPHIVTPDTLTALALVRTVDEYGGSVNLHTIIDDWNLGDNHFDEKHERRIKENLYHASAAQLDAELACFYALKALAETERASVLAMNEGYLSARETDDA